MKREYEKPTVTDLSVAESKRYYMILWFKDRGVFSGNVPPPDEWEKMQHEADVVIEHNVVIKNRHGRSEVGITNAAIGDLRMMTLASQLAFFQTL